jgi:pilus assembly protein CpaB
VTAPRSPSDWMREVRRAVAWHRRLVAAALIAAAIAFGLATLAPPDPPGTDVLVAAHDLSGGTLLRAADLRVRTIATAAVPDGVLTPRTRPQGRLLAGPVRAGEVMTDVRLVDRAALRGYGAGLVATPVRIADPAVAALLRPGDIVDVLAADGGAPGAATVPGASVVAAGVHVVTVPQQSTSAFDAGSSAAGGLVVLATTAETARALTAAAASAPLAVTIEGR